MSKFASLSSSLDGSMRRITFAVGFSGTMILALNRIVCSKYTQISIANDTKKNEVKTKKKLKMSESISFLASSQYLRCVATLVISYGLMYNFAGRSYLILDVFLFTIFANIFVLQKYPGRAC